MEQRALLEAESEEVQAQRRAARKADRRAQAASAPARVVRANRQQVELRPMDLDSVLPPLHRARAIWALVEQLDLSAFYAPIKARGSWAGRDATDPQVLLAVWLYATATGVGSAREVERLCAAHAAYRWLRGGVAVNYHTLSDFRTAHGAALDQLLTQVLAAMAQQGLVTLKRVAQDGTRIRAAAGERSFRRRARLEEFEAQAAAQVQALREQIGAAAGGGRPARQQAAQARAARERQQRVTQALAELQRVETERAEYKAGTKEPRGAARGSTTDPAARFMRMPDGGRRPAYNLQVATETAAEVIVGVHVSQGRTDFAEALPMIKQVEQRCGHKPAAILLDTGYTSQANIEALADQEVTLYGALPARRGKPDPYAARPTDSASLSALKERMRSQAGQAIYRERGQVSERVNGDLKTWRTLERLTVRGVPKVTCVALLNVIAYNLLRWMVLAPAVSAT
jgi:transposase